MKLLERLSKEHCAECQDKPVDCEIDWDDIHCTCGAFEIGFRKAREMAAVIGRDADSGGECLGPPWIEKAILALGEEEVKP